MNAAKDSLTSIGIGISAPSQLHFAENMCKHLTNLFHRHQYLSIFYNLQDMPRGIICLRKFINEYALSSAATVIGILSVHSHMD
jgi:hypothetical protein